MPKARIEATTPNMLIELLIIQYKSLLPIILKGYKPNCPLRQIRLNINLTCR